MKITKIIKNTSLPVVIIITSLIFSLTSFASSPCDTVPRLIVPFGNQSGVDQVLFGKDYKLLVTADKEQSIVWDARMGKPLYYLKGGKPAIDPANKYIVTAIDNKAYVWALNNGKQISNLQTDGLIVEMTFHPYLDIILIRKQYYEDENGPSAEDDCKVSFWNFSKGKSNVGIATKTETEMRFCEICFGNGISLDARGAFFNNTGDSVRLIGNNSIDTRALINGRSRRVTLYGAPSTPGTIVSVINDRMIERRDEGGNMEYYNEYGMRLGVYTGTIKIRKQQLGTWEKTVISPGGKYLAHFTASKFGVYDLLKNQDYTGEVKYIREARFNADASVLMIEYLDDRPHFYSLPSFSEINSLSGKDTAGLPRCVFATRREQNSYNGFDVVNVKDSVRAVIKKKPGLESSVLAILGSDINDMMDDFIDKAKAGTEQAISGSGDVINIYTGRTICSIESLVKPTGNIEITPDKQIMLVNTGSAINVYSIPEAKMIRELHSGAVTAGNISPDSRYIVTMSSDKTELEFFEAGTGVVFRLPFTRSPYEKHFISFSRKREEVAISNDKGEYKIFHIATRKLVSQGSKKLSVTLSPGGDKYAYYDPALNRVLVYRREDSSKLFEAFAGDVRVADDETPRMIFHEGTNALLIWNKNEAYYSPDMQQPVKKIFTKDSRESSLYDVQLSPNGKYAFLQFYSGPGVLVDLGTLKPVFGTIDLDDIESFRGRALLDNAGKMMKSMTSGSSLESLLFYPKTVSFSVTGDSLFFFLNEVVKIFSCKDGRVLKSMNIDGDARFFDMTRDLLVVNKNGEIKLYRISDGKEWFSLIPFFNGENVFLLPNRKYYGDKTATRHLGYIYEGKNISYKQFDINNNRPDLVLRALGNTDPQVLRLYDSVFRIRKIRENDEGYNDMNQPLLTIVNENEIMGEMNNSSLQLKLHLESNETTLSKILLTINGVPVYGQKGHSLKPGQPTVDTSISVTLSEGANLLEVSAIDKAGRESYRQPLTVQYLPATPSTRKLFFIGIGAAKYKEGSQNLNWAVKDILDVMDTLHRQYKTNMIIDTLFNSSVSVDKLMAFKKDLQKSRPDDKVIIYYSGHGIIDPKKAEAFFGSYEMDFKDPSVKGISLGHFEDLLDNIPARNRVIFLDACHSGEIYKLAWTDAKTISNPVSNNADTLSTPDDVLDRKAESIKKGDDVVYTLLNGKDPFDLVLELFTDINTSNGNHIIAAARGLEAAKEVNALQHGLFTNYVLAGLANQKADDDDDGRLTVTELRNYTLREVEKATSNNQRAVNRKENEYNNWIVSGNDNISSKNNTSAGRKISMTGRQVFNGTNKRTEPVLDAQQKKDLQNSELMKGLTQSILPMDSMINSIGKQLKGLFGGSEDEKETASKKPSTKPVEEKNNPLMNSIQKALAPLSGGEDKQEQQMTSLLAYANKGNKKSSLIASAPSYEIRYERSGDNIIFDITCPGLSPSFSADVNQNGKWDSCIDRAYALQSNSKSICTSLYFSKGGTTTCGSETRRCNKPVSAANLLSLGDRILFLVPIAELTEARKKIMIRFKFYDPANRKWIFYPSVSNYDSADQLVEIKL